MATRFALMSVFSVLCGCASVGATAAPGPRQAETRPPAPPRILMSTLPGWTAFEADAPAGEASVGFRNADAVITARTVHSPGETPGSVTRGAARRLAEGEGVTCTPLFEGDAYASMKCAGGSGPIRALIAVRRPSGGRDGLLLVMAGIWPASLPESFDEEVDLMFLLATAE